MIAYLTHLATFLLGFLIAAIMAAGREADDGP